MNKDEKVDRKEICANCGHRRGLHAETDDQCPHFDCGEKFWNGWVDDSYFKSKEKSQHE